MSPPGWSPRIAYPVVFVAGFCLLLLEITAGRLLAPAVGISLETWTGIIGIVLVGFAVGDALGGLVIDRSPSPRALAVTLAAAGITVLVSMPVAAALGGVWLDAPIFLRVVVISAAVLLLPCALLGAVAPMAARLTMRAVEQAGRTAGWLSAVATVSSVLGVIFGGFFLLERLGVRAILTGTGAALAVLALAVWALAGGGGDARLVRATPVSRQRPQHTAAPLPLLYLAPALSGAAVMAVELAGARIIAPLFGASLYTWASVIGVVLLGISLGNAMGGQLADRNPSKALLGSVLIGAGAATLLVLAGPFLYADIWPQATRRLLAAVPPAGSLPLLIGGMLFLPALLFGAISPIVIRIMVATVEEAGGVVGRVYAAQAAGSVAATLATGFLLISRVGTRAVILLVAEGVLLVGVLLAAGGRRRMLARPFRVAAAGAFALVLVAAVTGRVPSPCLRESNYYCIRVLSQGEHVRVLALDGLFHSYVDLRDTTRLLYEYEQGFAMITADYAARVAGATEDGSAAGVSRDLTAVRPLRVLLIGGGGYVVPRYLRRVYPASMIEVVEIDPAVTAVAQVALGLTPGGMIIHHQDGRQFLMRRPRAAYDLIFGDTFRDAYSAPYHLATVETTAMIADALRPGGAFAVNVVDRGDGLFMRSYLRTLRHVFRYVAVLPVGANWQSTLQTTYVLLASRRPIDPARILARRPPGVPQRVDLVAVSAEMTDRLIADPAVLLTDDRAPVDQFLARLYAAAVREKAGP